MKGQEISKKIIKPENCIIVFGIPTSKEKFRQHQLSKNSDFAKRFTNWSQYHYQFVSNIERLSPIITELGVSIIYDLKFRDFETLFNKNKIDVIVLFSHWNSNSIEFDDGLADIQSIVNKIPLDFYGILDLCVCHPEELTKMLRKFRPNCLVKYTHKKATPFLWIYFYMVLLKYLKDYDVTYLEALEKIINEFLTNNKR
jgi:hypothetical protein